MANKSGSLKELLQRIFSLPVKKIVISKPKDASVIHQKVLIERKANKYHISKFTKTQAFHENIPPESLLETCIGIITNQYLQINSWVDGYEHIILISKKGNISYKTRKILDAEPVPMESVSQNRQKKYLFAEGNKIAPLIDMGIFTADGHIVKSCYDKYRQINRFVELLDDEIEKLDKTRVKVIDFGCGKSYLTFLVYYYLTEIKGLDAEIIGVDLKKDVIDKCNITAAKYGYEKLRFVTADIETFCPQFEVDIVMTLHACDTATDYALFNAIKWNAKIILSVPCCQHELNLQIAPQNLKLLTRYGIVRERFSALATDAIRGNLLECCGYRTQLIEFIDFSHTPKNILIRAVRRPHTEKKHKDDMMKELLALMREFSFTPKLYTLLLEHEYVDVEAI